MWSSLNGEERPLAENPAKRKREDNLVSVPLQMVTWDYKVARMFAFPE